MEEFYDEDIMDNLIWKCKDGTKIKVSDMSDKHLINAINMINRMHTDEKTFYILSKEMKRRGLKVPERNILFDCDATIQDTY